MLELFSESNDIVWHDIVCSQSGRIFSSVGNVSDKLTKVYEIDTNGRWKQFQEIDNSHENSPVFTDIRGITIDEHDVLWTVDLVTHIPSCVKLQAFNLHLNKCIARYLFPLCAGVNISKIRIWQGYAIMSELKRQSLIFIRISDGSQRKIDLHMLNHAHPNLYSGSDMCGRDTVVDRGLFIEISSYKKQLFIFPSGSGIMYSLNLDCLLELFNKNTNPVKSLERLSIPLIKIRGVCVNSKGGLFLADKTNNGISLLNDDGSISKLVTANILSNIKSLAVNSENIFYITTIQLNEKSKKKSITPPLKLSAVLRFS